MNALAENPPLEFRTQAALPWKTVGLALLLASIIAGIAAIAHIPLNLILLLLPLGLAIWVLKRFVQHNSWLISSLGWGPVIRNFFGTFVLSCLLLPIVVPGLTFGLAVSHLLDSAIGLVGSWSAPTIQTKEITHFIETQIKRPWWYAPAVYLKLCDDYVTQVGQEVEVISEAIQKPWPIRATAAALRFLLQSLSILSSTWCGLLFLNLFLRVFGRRLLCRNPNIRISLSCNPILNAGETEAFAKTVETEHSCSLSVQIGPKETLFVKPSDLPAGAVPDVSLRLHDGAIVARLLYQLFVMSRVVDIDGSGLVFHAPNGGQYISVMLSEGQTVAVDPHSLAAYTSSVHFDRHWDFNIAVVGLDRIFYLLAKGPGMLVMRCNGGPVISTDAEEMPSVPMERMLLFDAKSSFRALASDGALNHILSACVLKPERGGIFVAGPVSAHHHTGLGRLWKFIKHCYVPI